MSIDEAFQISLRSDVNLYLATRGRGQWFTAAQLYDALGLAQRSGGPAPGEFGAFLEELANHKVVHRWRSPASSAPMFGLP